MKTFILLLGPDGACQEGGSWYKRTGNDASEAVAQLMSDMGASDTDVVLAVEVTEPVQVVAQETRWGVRGTAG